MPLFGRLGRTPVRLRESNEVIWCQRLSPARARILSVPLPESEHGYGDVVVHDGEPAGKRIAGGHAYTVFDEVLLSRSSPYSTFSATVIAPTAEDLAALEDATGDDIELQVEDWTSSVKLLCAACSRGDVGHDHHHADDGEWAPERSVGIAALDLAAANELLTRWARSGKRRSFRDLDVSFSGRGPRAGG